MTRDRPRPHLPSVLGRARADTAALVLVLLVVALTTCLAAAVPPLADRTADRAVADAVRRAGDAGAVVVTSPFEEDDETAERVRDPALADQVRATGEDARFTVPPDLRRVLGPGVAAVSTAEPARARWRTRPLPATGLGGRCRGRARGALDVGPPTTRRPPGPCPAGTAGGAVAGAGGRVAAGGRRAGPAGG
ncbi:hypothetical protein GCM10025868_01130 [Angustibacter aerolatus]|uniref:Uncharacterized protein n=1 Tax=Angustibacter aerolatus TaxID=1162965 RepID=A0ABQ6J9N7_9ACTN|nr:hypothetical protein [Angustibacter aerolatus]GMA84863.1 hypothetical protein GCM10025868_01130 [Angustibacter aerolatus]